MFYVDVTACMQYLEMAALVWNHNHGDSLLHRDNLLDDINYVKMLIKEMLACIWYLLSIHLIK